MADKAVSELIAAERIGPGDMFVLEQDGTAKKLTGQVLLNWLFNAVDGHGGIKSIGKIKTVGLVDTYRITLSDGSTFDFTVKNGEKGDVGVFTTSGEKTNLEMGGYKIRNLGTPTEDGDAVNLAHMKAAVQEARPRDLLDNSDFRNPVNERGLTSYTTTSTYGLYCIDRWRTYHSNDTVTVNNGYIAVSNRLYQVIPAEKIDTSKTYTAVAMKTDGTLLINVIRGITTTQSGTPSLYLNGQAITFRLTASGGNFIWAALYEGEYTAETLPEYQPKGHGAELAECTRYFRVIHGDTYLVGVRGYNAAKDVMIYFGDEMRVIPTVTLAGKSNITAAQGTTNSNLTRVSTIGRNYFALVGDSDLPERGPVGIYCNDDVYLSADL